MSKTFLRKYVTISTSVPLKITTDRTNQVIELLPGFYQFENEKDERYTFSPDIGEEVKVSDTDIFFHEGVRSVDGEIDALDADLEMMAGAMESMGDAIDGLSAKDAALDARLTTIDSAGWVTEQRISNESISKDKIKTGAIRSEHLSLTYNGFTSASTANGATVVVTGPIAIATQVLLRVTLGSSADWRLLSVFSSGSNWCARLLNNTGSPGTCTVSFVVLNPVYP